jgi:uncharacterized protein (TIGR02996 family)|nr:DUF3553 domain-containing protein [Kofleriaceae bacterium]
MPVWIEPSPSSRAACRTCGEAIELGVARVAIQDRNAYGSDLVYHHLACAEHANPDLVLRALADVRPGAAVDRDAVGRRVAIAVGQRGGAVRARMAEAEAAGARPAAEPTADRLVDQLADDPGDRGALAVLADHLQQAGDPRGELIALQLAGDLSPRALALQAELALPATATAGAPIATWGVGYYRGLDLGARSALAPIWTHPSLRLLRELVLRFAEPLAAPSIDYLIASLPRTLRQLSMVDPDPADLAPRLAAALPRLDSLSISRRLDLRALAHPRLRRLELWAGSEPLEVAVAQLQPDALPALDALVLGGAGDRRFDASCTVLQQAGWLSRLRALQLHYGNVSAAAIAALAAGLGDRCLDVVDVSNAHVTAGGVDKLARLCRELVLPDGSRRPGAATWIEHAQHPEWGRGRITARRDGKLEIAFEHAGTKVFAATARALVTKP